MKKLKNNYEINSDSVAILYSQVGKRVELVKEENTKCLLVKNSDGDTENIVYVNESEKALNYDDVKDILISMDLNFSEKFKCENYVIISKPGYLNKSRFNPYKKVNVLDIQELNIKLEGSEYVENLAKAVKSKKRYIEVNAHNKIALDKVLKGYEMGETMSYVSHATGTGKSVLVSELVERFGGTKIIISSSSVILSQFQKHLSHELDNITLLTYNKLSNMKSEEILELINNNLSLVVVDEFHRGGAPIWGKSLNTLLDNLSKDVKVFGTSATPTRYLDDSRDMGEEIFDKESESEISLYDAIVRKILPMPKYVAGIYNFTCNIHELESKLKTSRNSDLEKQVIYSKLNQLKYYNRNHTFIQSLFEKHLEDRKNFVVFCRDITQIEEMKDVVFAWFETYKANNNIDGNINIFEAHSRMSNPKGRIQEFIEKIESDNNDYNIILSVDMLNEGLHSDSIHGVILLRPTMSPTIYYQQIGRALKVNLNHVPLIIDLVNNSDNVQLNAFITGLRESNNRLSETAKDLAMDRNPVNILIENIYDEIVDVKELLLEIENSIKTSWNYMFNKLRTFKSFNGHTFVTASSDPKLSRWCEKQRFTYKNGQLSEERIAMLEGIDFKFSVQEARWVEKYCKLRKKLSGISMLGLDMSDDSELSRWVANQRSSRKRGALSKEKIEMLDSIGFIWDVKSLEWENNYNQIKGIFDKIGHTHLLTTSNIAKGNGNTVTYDNKLISWIKSQRVAFAQGCLSSERIEKLNAVNFIFEVKLTAWDRNIQKLEAFVRENGHSMVDSEYKDKSLYNFCRNVKREKNTLSESQVKSLNSLGFIWSQADYAWSIKFNELVAYRRLHGTTIIDPKLEEYKALRLWVNSLRGGSAKSLLSEERIKKLNDIGFIWDLADHRWIIMFNEIKSLIEETGEYEKKRTLLKYKGEYPLSSWIGTQRKAHIAGKLLKNREELLAGIGIKFD